GHAVTQVPLVAEGPRARAPLRAEADGERHVALEGVRVDHRDGRGVRGADDGALQHRLLAVRTDDADVARTAGGPGRDAEGEASRHLYRHQPRGRERRLGRLRVDELGVNGHAAGLDPHPAAAGVLEEPRPVHDEAAVRARRRDARDGQRGNGRRAGAAGQERGCQRRQPQAPDAGPHQRPPGHQFPPSVYETPKASRMFVAKALPPTTTSPNAPRPPRTGTTPPASPWSVTMGCNEVPPRKPTPAPTPRYVRTPSGSASRSRYVALSAGRPRNA